MRGEIGDALDARSLALAAVGAAEARRPRLRHEVQIKRPCVLMHVHVRVRVRSCVGMWVWVGVGVCGCLWVCAGVCECM